jgi:hypothetical protein
MLLVWSGRGYLVPVFTFAACLLIEWAVESAHQDDRYYQEHAWPVSAGLAVGGGLSLGASRLVGRTRTSPLEQPSLAPSRPRSRNTFFFIPMVYWGFILLALAVVHAATGPWTSR